MNTIFPARMKASAARGFSLLEVLVSIAIFAMAFIVILSTYANILSSYQHIRADREADEDVKFARAALLAEPDIQKAQDGDEYDATGERHVRWSSTITPSDTIADLFSVEFECEISAPGAGDPEKVTQTFMVVRPTWSDPAERDKLLQATKAQIADLQGKLPNGFIAGTPPSPNGGGGGGGGGFGGGGGGRGGRGGPGGGGRGGRGGPGGAGGPGGGNFGNGGGFRGGNGNGGGGGRFNGGGNGGGGNGNFQRGGGNGGGGRGAGGAGGAGGGGGFRGGGGAGTAGGAGGATGGGR